MGKVSWENGPRDPLHRDPLDNSPLVLSFQASPARPSMPEGSGGLLFLPIPNGSFPQATLLPPLLRGKGGMGKNHHMDSRLRGQD